jgi:hypothetical protein
LNLEEDGVVVRFLMMLVVVVGASAGWVLADDASSLPRVFTDDFERGADRWQPTDPGAWRIVESDRGKVYNQFQQSDYQPPHRSPYNISLLKDILLSDFELTVDLQSTNVKAGNHRDMCVFFGYQDPAHFYYVHLGQRPDPHSSQIMRVDDAPRVMITKNQTPGIPWTEGWHRVKVVRRTDDGTIEVYFDDMDKPVMVAQDKTFTWGQVGIGSFDDHGNWDHFQLNGKRVQRPANK